MKIHGTPNSLIEAKAYERAARLRTDVDGAIQSTQDKAQSEKNLNKAPGDCLVLGNKIAEKTWADCHLKFNPQTKEAASFEAQGDRSEDSPQKLFFRKEGDELHYERHMKVGGKVLIEKATFHGLELDYKSSTYLNTGGAVSDFAFAGNEGTAFVVPGNQIGHFPDFQTAHNYRKATWLQQQAEQTGSLVAAQDGTAHNKSTISNLVRVDGMPDPGAKQGPEEVNSNYQPGGRIHLGTFLTGSALKDPATGQLKESDVTIAHAGGNYYDLSRFAIEQKGESTLYHHESLQNRHDPHKHQFFQTLEQNHKTGDLRYQEKTVEVALFGDGPHFQDMSQGYFLDGDPTLAQKKAGFASRLLDWSFAAYDMARYGYTI